MKTTVFQVMLASLIIMSGTQLVYGQTAEIIEEGITDIIIDETGQLVDQIVGDIDFGNDNFLNTNAEETENLKNSGIQVLQDSFDLALSVKDLASDGVVFISPYDLSPFLVAIIGFAFAGIFLFSLIKKVGKHILIMIVIGGVIVMAFVMLKIEF